MIRRPPRSPLFPSTTLFRSARPLHAHLEIRSPTLVTRSATDSESGRIARRPEPSQGRGPNPPAVSPKDARIAQGKCPDALPLTELMLAVRLTRVPDQTHRRCREHDKAGHERKA